MDALSWINGEQTVEIISADVAGILSVLSSKGIQISDVCVKDALTVRLCIRRQDRKTVEQIVSRKGAEVRTLCSRGFYYGLLRFIHRPVLAAGVLILLLGAVFLPSRIYFFRVDGNVHVPARRILEQAENCGISFGASRREVRSEKVKNALLQAMPELQWAGVNTYGCVAVISVEERESVTQDTVSNSVSRIVAARDGVILSVTATKGNPLCAVGQAVKRGEALISGYTDCGISIRATRAVGEIFARTEQELTVVTPSQYSVRQAVTRQETKYSLILGKKRINFYKGSGILQDTCDRMYEENYVTLPGGFQLPVAIVTEVWTYYDSMQVQIGEETASAQLRDCAAWYLGSHMIAGQILSKEESVVLEDGVYVLRGQYACHEMIGREQTEEIIAPYGKHD